MSGRPSAGGTTLFFLNHLDAFADHSLSPFLSRSCFRAMISHFSFCFLLSFSPRASRLHPIETVFFQFSDAVFLTLSMSSSFSYTQIKSLGLRKRPGTGSGSNIAAKGGAANSSILKFYTDDSPGLKITPVVVLVMSVCFIGFVTILHAMSKIYQYKMS